MKFEHILKASATLKKEKKYDFLELTESDIKEGLKRVYETELLVKRNQNVLGLYAKEGRLIVTMYHSYDRFGEIAEAQTQK